MDGQSRLARESRSGAQPGRSHGQPPCIVLTEGEAATTEQQQVCQGLASRGTVRKILVAMGGIAACETNKLPLAETMARAFGSELILLHVLPIGAIPNDDTISPREARACAYLEMIAARMHA